MNKVFEKIIAEIKSSITNDEARFETEHLWVNRIFVLIALFMSVVNFFTEKYTLLYSTAIFALLCLLNICVMKKGKNGIKIASILFIIEIFLLYLFFIIVGTPEGFSAIWVCLLPSCGLLLFGREKGTILSLIMLVFILFLFWTPMGRSFLMYPYTQSFLLRFPMLYIAFYLVSLFLETVRVITQRELISLEEKYQTLYKIDALTDIYNRYGFDEKFNEIINNKNIDSLSLIFVDIDFFKRINDEFGHANGDYVLSFIANFLKTIVASRGYVCRWGGEEFAILINDTSKTALICETILKKIAETNIKIEDSHAKITLSLGAVTCYNKNTLVRKDFVKLADKALYEAKATGRNKVVYKEI